MRSEEELPSKDSLTETNDQPKADEDKKNLEFLIKWVGKSYIHNTWVPEIKLQAIAKIKLNNYLAKYSCELINLCMEQWTHPQRILGVRAGKENEEEVLVKWCGLGYEECTWENVNEPVIRDSIELINQFKDFEYEALHKDMANDSINRNGQEIGPLVEQPKDLKGGTLFPHQLEALNWLRSCWHQSKNVILADEMGLGKTISASAFLSALYCEFRIGLPSLVLAPLSTIPNWEAEFSSWVPHLNVVGYYGNARARALIRRYEWHAGGPGEASSSNSVRPYKFNILLTTYETVLADAAHLCKIPWALLIVDEGHRLKNSNSRLFGILSKFSFQQRVLLTGTPLQNNLGEMFNLLNFLQPDTFPSLSAFEEKFNDLTNADKVDELRKLVAPHMLRRLKKDALQNLPPKTELVVPVELSPIQAEYYRAMLTKNYKVLFNMGKGTSGSSASHQQSLLNIVMQLRKICNHPYLIAGTEPESGSQEVLHAMRIKASAKLSLLHLMLRHLCACGHRVLIFSQMTKLLDILEDYILDEFGSETYERVDGSVSVTERQAAIARFNEDKTRFVFLLSTRSCGLGINLATADTVIIYDSDFNPHADIQAISRAHRIGQTNELAVYRLMVRASVEERILQLAKKKLMLDQLFVSKSSSQKEVEDIIKWGTTELFSEVNRTKNGNSDSQGDDSNNSSNNNVDEVREHQHRKRVGGLGDVYDNRCLEPSITKLVWDENAVEKLLDRSGMQDKDEVDNELLGSVQVCSSYLFYFSIILKMSKRYLYL
jgi:SNF2 family DNA or RNA helicase